MKISFTRQTIYTYYKSRDEVLLDLLDRRIQQFYEDILAFKRTMYKAFPVFTAILRDQCRAVTEDACCHFCITIMIYMSSISPLLNQTPLQMRALQEAADGMAIPSDREIVLSSLLLMTSAFHFKGDGDEKTVNP